MKPNRPQSASSIHAQARSFARLATTALGLCAAMAFLSQSIAQDARELSRADTKFVEQEAAASMNSIRLGELAEKNSPSPEVQAFAKEVVADQKMANEQITTFASSRNVEIAEVKADDNTRVYTNLNKADRANFDKDYLDAVITENKRGVSDIERLSKNSDTDSDLKAWAEKMLPTVQARLTKAEALRAALDAGSTSASTSL